MPGVQREADAHRVTSWWFQIFGTFHGHGGTLKWMVEKGKSNPIKMDDLGVPLFQETPIFDPFE